ncbi:MAG: UvrB/UvrC motif-containing protein, partial [bacterium]|nr:UvrB/UvrC motif-containing protein [bacterium]
INDIRELFGDPTEKDIRNILKIELSAEPDEIAEVIDNKEREMRKAARDLEFELAALLRDEINELNKELEAKKKEKKKKI